MSLLFRDKLLCSCVIVLLKCLTMVGLKKFALNIFTTEIIKPIIKNYSRINIKVIKPRNRLNLINIYI